MKHYITTTANEKILDLDLRVLSVSMILSSGKAEEILVKDFCPIEHAAKTSDVPRGADGGLDTQILNELKGIREILDSTYRQRQRCTEQDREAYH